MCKTDICSTRRYVWRGYDASYVPREIHWTKLSVRSATEERKRTRKPREV
jgi:hypothetical protein